MCVLTLAKFRLYFLNKRLTFNRLTRLLNRFENLVERDPLRLCENTQGAELKELK